MENIDVSCYGRSVATVTVHDRSGSGAKVPRGSVPTGIVRDGIRRARSSGSADTVLIDIRTCDLTLSQVMEGIRMLSMGLPGHEVFMDGDLYSIVARRRPSCITDRVFAKGTTV